ncbi:helix-turn-helix domain-containing protein [Streptomyces sp. NPDC058646]|uniref:helix-turn-helix domain-containing protein n=1 Tax=Streptomyces sp. NPDC058646 TaxID=3346574 RepID=UPI00364FBA7C
MTRSVKELGLPSPEERRRLREAADLTHEQVAAAVGVAPATVRSWESGRTDPRGRKRALYARLLLDLGAPPPHDAEGARTGGGHAAAGEAGAEGEAAGARKAAHPEEPQEREEAQEPQEAPEPREPQEAQAAPEGQERERAGAAVGREDGAGRGPSLRAFGSARASAGGAQGRPAGPGTRPRTAAKRAAKPAVALPRHEARTPVAAAAGAGPRPASGGQGPGGSAEATAAPAAAATAGEPEHTAADTPADTPADRAGARAVLAEPSEQSAEQPAGPGPEPDPQPEPAPVLSPAGAADATAAFDALYGRAAADLARQAYLLTGHRALAHEAVERAFQQAWAQWPDVATDPDPVGWVRAAVYEYALSPWHRFRRTHRSGGPSGKPPAEPGDRILLDAVLALAPAHRRTVLLYDGVGLDLPDTAAETEASTPTAAHRLLHAHEELAGLLPELVDVPPGQQSALLHERFATLEPAVRLVPRPAAEVRLAGEHRAKRWTRAVLGLTAVIAVATAYTVSTAPREYEPPRSPGASVSGVPPHSGPQRLTEQSRQLHDKLRADPAAGPARLVPRTE